MQNACKVTQVKMFLYFIILKIIYRLKFDSYIGIHLEKSTYYVFCMWFLTIPMEPTKKKKEKKLEYVEGGIEIEKKTR